MKAMAEGDKFLQQLSRRKAQMDQCGPQNTRLAHVAFQGRVLPPDFFRAYVPPKIGCTLEKTGIDEDKLVRTCSMDNFNHDTANRKSHVYLCVSILGY